MANQWFHEESELWPGQAFSFEYETILFDEKSTFQHVQVFQSVSYGRVLVLDGAVQLTEREEFAYHESMSNIPLLSHPNPEKVVVSHNMSAADRV